MSPSRRRAIKFFVIRRFLLPLGILLLKGLAMTWRLDREAEGKIGMLLAAEKAILMTCHGHALSVLPFTRFAKRAGRRPVLLSSPSRDGHLLDDTVGAFEMDVVKGSSASKAVSGSRAVIRVVREGRIAILAIDGPRGPRAVPKAGFLSLARLTGARLFIVSVGARRRLTFGSWDRMFLPLPFARVDIRLVEYTPLPAGEETEVEALQRLHVRLVAEARAVGSPVAEGLSDPTMTKEVPLG